MTPFKLTYSTMFDPPAALHQRFEQALEGLPAVEGQTHPMWIDGREAWAQQSFELRSPIDRTRLLGRFQLGQAEHAQAAVRAAHVASRSWAATPWQERVAIMRRVAEKISDNSLELSAIMVMEVGKSRLEALGEVEETEPHYQLVVDREHGHMDNVELWVEVSESVVSDEVRHLEVLERKIGKELESVLGLSVKIRLVEPKSITRSEGKAKRVVDRRDLGL